MGVSAKKMIDSGIPFQYYVNSADATRAIFHVLIPGTAWTLELNGLNDAQKPVLQKYAWPPVGHDDPDEIACRNNNLTKIHTGPEWWKVTYAAPDADAAADFAIRYLGASKVPSP